MKKKNSFVPPPGPRVISFHPNGRAQSEKLAKRQLKRAMGKTKHSKVEKEEELRQLDADWETATYRKILTPKTKLRAQLFEVPWPDVHAEMDLNELITARVSLAAKLAAIFEQQYISFYKDADSACTALSAVITTLQCLAMSMNDQQKDSIWFLQFVAATTRMEYAVELLTCKMLDPTSPQYCRLGGGPLLLRIHIGSHWKSIEKKISKEAQEVQALVAIGDILTTGFKGGQWEFVRGVLETFGVFWPAKRSDGDSGVRQMYLLTKSHFLKQIERREDSPAQATQNYYAPLTGSEDLAACRLLCAVSRCLPTTTPHTCSDCAGSNCTGSNLVPRNTIKHQGLKRLRERGSTHYRETSAHDDSDSSADGDAAGKINKKSESRKRLKLNPNMRLLAEPEPGPSSQETPAMRRVRMEIEGVHIYEEKIVVEPKGIVSGRKYGTDTGGTDREEQVL